MNNVLKMAPPFRKKDVDTVCDGFEKLLDHPIEFEIVEDKNLLGGFVAFVDGMVYDASFSSQLKGMKQSFTE